MLLGSCKTFTSINKPKKFEVKLNLNYNKMALFFIKLNLKKIRLYPAQLKLEWQITFK